jgi:hypothetical protein
MQTQAFPDFENDRLEKNKSTFHIVDPVLIPIPK